MIYSCNMCELCKTVCPVDLDTGALIMESRIEAVTRGMGPLPEHKPIIGYFNAGVSNLFSLTKPAPGREKAKRLFFTGCALPATAPAYARLAYEEALKHYPDFGVLMYCCGAPVEMLGMEKEFEVAIEHIQQQVDNLSTEEIAVACPDCHHTLEAALPGIKVSYIWEFLAEKWEPPRNREGTTVAIHDSCKARHDPEVHEAIRTLIEAGGGKVEDVEYAKEMARCCGFGGMIAPVDMELCQSITKRRAEESEHPMITYCAGCRMALAGQGKPAIHILDYLLYPDFEKKTVAKAPGSIGRYANRLKLKWKFKRLRAPKKGEVAK
jgi:Fe-S oxidoreductase